MMQVPDGMDSVDATEWASNLICARGGTVAGAKVVLRALRDRFGEESEVFFNCKHTAQDWFGQPARVKAEMAVGATPKSADRDSWDYLDEDLVGLPDERRDADVQMQGSLERLAAARKGKR